MSKEKCLACAALFLICLKCYALGGGTTKYLKNIFIGRCYEYQSLAKQNKLDALQTNINCTAVWETFYHSFAYKDPCNVTNESYKEFFQLISSTKKIHNALFWSGAHELISQFRYINDEYIALEDTFPGYLFDNMQWCGSPSSPDGLNYQDCSGKCSAAGPVWNLASSKFAARATGVAHVLLNASRNGNKPAYYKGSTFRSVEMPRLKIRKLVVYVASSIGTNIRETCDDNSLLELKSDAKKKNISIECVDQPELVLRIYCIKYPKAKQCMMIYKGYSEGEETEETKIWRLVAIIFCVICALLLLGIAIWITNRLFSRKENTVKPPGHVNTSNNNNATIKNEQQQHDKTENIRNGQTTLWI